MLDPSVKTFTLLAGHNLTWPHGVVGRMHLKILSHSLVAVQVRILNEIISILRIRLQAPIALGTVSISTCRNANGRSLLMRTSAPRNSRSRWLCGQADFS